MVKANRQLGFTLVELLVVIAIIGVLLAILLPAVQAARESGRKTTCLNNVKEICLATLAYSSSHQGRLPASWRAVRNEHGQDQPGSDYEYAKTSFSWRTSILPFLGEQPLFDQLQLDLTPFADENVDSVALILSAFQCPTTPDAPRTALSKIGKLERQMGANDYVHLFFVGTEETDSHRAISGEHLPCAWYGVQRFDSPSEEYSPLYTSSMRGGAPLRYIVDGLSRTALVAEKAGYPNTYLEGSVVDPSPWGEGAWAAGEFGAFGKAQVNWSNFPSFYSFHSSGAHVGLCDGAARLLAEDTALDVIVALCSRGGGEAE
jgi:prepilin-type N-terminal cleavage/methylation domain-containing protein